MPEKRVKKHKERGVSKQLFLLGLTKASVYYLESRTSKQFELTCEKKNII